MGTEIRKLGVFLLQNAPNRKNFYLASCRNFESRFEKIHPVNLLGFSNLELPACFRRHEIGRTQRNIKNFLAQIRHRDCLSFRNAVRSVFNKSFQAFKGFVNDSRHCCTIQAVCLQYDAINNFASPLEGEACFQCEQKLANIRTQGEGCHNWRRLL